MNTGTDKYEAIRQLQKLDEEAISTTGLLPMLPLPPQDEVEEPGSMFYRPQAE